MPLAAAIRYAVTHLKRLKPYLDHGVLELANNAAIGDLEKRASDRV